MYIHVYVPHILFIFYSYICIYVCAHICIGEEEVINLRVGAHGGNWREGNWEGLEVGKKRNEC